MRAGELSKNTEVFRALCEVAVLVKVIERSGRVVASSVSLTVVGVYLF